MTSRYHTKKHDHAPVCRNALTLYFSRVDQCPLSPDEAAARVCDSGIGHHRSAAAQASVEPVIGFHFYFYAVYMGVLCTHGVDSSYNSGLPLFSLSSNGR